MKQVVTRKVNYQHKFYSIPPIYLRQLVFCVNNSFLLENTGGHTSVRNKVIVRFLVLVGRSKMTLKITLL